MSLVTQFSPGIGRLLQFAVRTGIPETGSELPRVIPQVNYWPGRKTWSPAF